MWAQQGLTKKKKKVHNIIINNVCIYNNQHKRKIHNYVYKSVREWKPLTAIPCHKYPLGCRNTLL